MWVYRDDKSSFERNCGHKRAAQTVSEGEVAFVLVAVD